MSRLVETIRTEEGKLLNTDYHNERLIRSLYGVFGITKEIDLDKIITIPETSKKGIFKCRVEYDREIRKIEFLPYTIRPVKSLKLIEDNEIDYRYKFVDRTAIDRLMAGRAECDDILIIKNGSVTDSSYANVILMDQSGNWVTPSTCLLPGTRRASLLHQGLITEAKISYNDLNKYTKVKLINAMIGIDDTEGIPISNII
jgi:4-amino-4-deoxychorismate lyase